MRVISTSTRAAVSGLDHARARLLEFSLQSAFLRDIFKSRPRRLLFQFFVSFSWQLPLAIFFPVPMLILGPAILGVPHLFSSLRHGVGHPREIFTSRRALLMAVLAIWIAVGFARYFDRFDHPLIYEAGGMLLTFIIAWPFRRLPLRQWLPGAVILGVLALAIDAQPLLMVGFLVLFHNFVGFFHWWKGARNPKDRRTVALCFAGFLLAHAVIFAGAFDAWIGQATFSGIDALSFGPTFEAWSAAPEWTLRAVVAYAFGQSMHYFVWLKCIPDQHHSTQISTSFRQSHRLLEKDFGKWGVAAAVIASVAMIALAVLLPNDDFRLIYFSVAAFHGFLEIAGLFLGLPNTEGVGV